MEAQESSIVSQRGKEKQEWDGYIYLFGGFSKADATISYWRCEKKRECKVTQFVFDRYIFNVHCTYNVLYILYCTMYVHYTFVFVVF